VFELVSRSRARRIAEEALREFADRHGVEVAVHDGGEFGEDGVRDFGDAWVVSWNSVEYLRTGDFLKQLLVGPIAVPKHLDARYVVLGTAGSIEEELDTWRALNWTPRKPAVRYYRSYVVRADGARADRALFRREPREAPGDLSGDAVFERDGRWHWTADIGAALRGFGRDTVREITETEALRVVTEVFGQPESALHSPTVVDRAAGPAGRS
jgi:hypothetical protein